MSYRKSRRLAGVLAVAVLGVLAFASSAQAIPLQSGFFIKGAQVGALKASFLGKQLGRSTFLIPALKLEINCEKLTLSGFITSTTHGEAQFLYEECTVLTNEAGNLVEVPGCEIVVNHTGDNKHHITFTGLLLPAELIDGTPAILLEKLSGLVLTKEGTGCILPKTTTMKGELCFKVDNNHTVEPELLASQAIQESCRPRSVLESTEEKTAAEGGIKDKMPFGISEAFFDGTIVLDLCGVHKGLTLGVLLI
jgi:hypothetical protein